MKKETYLEIVAKSRKKCPKPIIEFSVWIIVFCIVVIGMAITNFLIFFLSTRKHNTYAAVVSYLDILKFQYSSIIHSSIELAYISQGIWSNTSQMAIANITQKLQQIASISPLLTQN